MSLCWTVIIVSSFSHGLHLLLFFVHDCFIIFVYRLFCDSEHAAVRKHGFFIVLGTEPGAGAARSGWAVA